MCLTMFREQSPLTKETEEWTRSRVLQKRLLRKKHRQHFVSALQKKNKSKQISGSVFAERFEKVKKIKFELELIKFVDCFLDGHYTYDSKSVSFKIKSIHHTMYFVTVSESNKYSQTIQIGS